MAVFDPDQNSIINVEVLTSEAPFGGVLVETIEGVTQIEINTGSPVSSVFGRTGDINALCSDYALCYAPLGTQIPAGGLPGQTLAKLGANDYDVAWTNAGAGSVTNFSAGSLSPIFGTSVADPSSTPALSFSLSNAGAHCFLGNNTGSSAPPAYVQPAFTDISGSLVLGQLPSTAESKLLGRGQGSGAGAVQEITLGTNLTMVGTTLNAIGGGGISDGDKGDITVSGGGTTWTIDPAAVTYAKIQNVAASSLLGNPTGSPASASEITLVSPLAFSTTTLQINTNGISNTLLRQGTALSVIGRNANSLGNVADIAATATSDAVLRESGSTLGFGTIATGGIANNAVTYAKMQQASAASILIGRGAGAGAGDLQEITLGTNLSMTGTVLNATGGGGGNVSNSGTPTVDQTAVWVDATHIKGVTTLKGGTTSQVLSKVSNTDYDWTWTTIAGGGNVSNSGTPVADQLPIWTDATHIKGVTGLTGGSLGQVLKKNSATDYDWSWGAVAAGAAGLDTQIQFNDGGTNLGGDADLTWNKTTNVLTNAGTYRSAAGSSSNVAYGQGADSGIWFDSSGNFYFGHQNFYFPLAIDAPNGSLLLASGTRVQWSNASQSPKSPPDVCLSRNAEGVLEINNGTAGQYRDLFLRKLIVGDTNNYIEKDVGSNLTLNQGSTIVATIGTFSPDGVRVDHGAFTGNGSVPTGGTTDQVLAKNSNSNYDLKWATAAGGGNVSNSGTPTLNQIAQWTDATHIQGVSVVPTANGGVPIGGTTNQVLAKNSNTDNDLKWYTLPGGGNVTTSATLTANALILGNGGVDTKISTGLNSDGQSQLILGVQGVVQGSLKLLNENTGSLTLADTAHAANISFTFPAATTDLSATGGTGHVLKQATAGGAITSGTLAASDVGLGNVTNDAQIKSADFPASSVDSEVALFNSTSGKSIKRATGSGIAKVSNGVWQTPIADTTVGDNLLTHSIPAGSDSFLKVATVTGAVTDVVAPAGAVVGTSDTQTLTNKRVTQRVVAQASGATWSPNGDTSDVFTITTAQATDVTTINAPSGTPTDGQKLIFRIKCDATPRNVSGWNAIYRFSSDMAAPTALVASKTLYLGFIYNSTDSKWDNVSQMNNF